jgi:hypothetical protein
MDAPEPVGVLVLRVWVEHDGVLKSRITSTVDPPAAERVAAASSVEEILIVVRDFVEDFVAVHS